MKRKNAIEPQVEALINKFFATLKHTPGPWGVGHTPFYLRMKQDGNPQTIRSPHHTEEIATVWTCQLPTKDNSRLISYAPDLLRSACRTYLTLLIQFEYGQNETLNQIRISMDGMLTDLRNKISLATGLEDKFIQETFESMAKEVV